ncbi:MAG: nucleotidyltransferase domain-containing protein [Candidatus Woesearchaeota archaeon]|nr:nucleotidyltransferase domain-containing protein [Candidatus Woesearchaeota archaeon]
MERIKTLFFEDTLKRWHFEDIVKASGMSRERVSHYLSELLKEKFVTRTKPRGKMPYYTANRDSGKFRAEKRFYGLGILQKIGLFEHINSIEGVKTAILFGSFSRGDFSKSSDIDLFIYGDSEQFDKSKFELKTKREVQLFSYNDKDRMKKELDPRLIPNILKGFNIKESIEPFRVDINA